MEPVMPSPLVGSLECNYCNKGFSTISNMNKHMRVVHNACPLCYVVFSTITIVFEGLPLFQEMKKKKVKNLEVKSKM